MQLRDFYVNYVHQPKDPLNGDAMQSEALRTVTARYILREDRIGLDCLVHNGDVMQLSFTHRMARALIAELVRRLELEHGRTLMNDFVQSDAVSSKTKSDAVIVTESHAPWLVTHVHVQNLVDATRLIFTEDDERAVHIDCSEHVLRNLIDIFHSAFATAEWDRKIFPSWVSGLDFRDTPAVAIN